MITSLTIKNVATYDSQNGVTINDLKKVNFFYGFNGTGKSTISKYLRNLTLDATEQKSEFNACTNIGYDKQLHHILTFNEDFIEENFKKSLDFKGVFSLNQSNAQIDQKIKDEENNIQSYVSSKLIYQNRLENLENNEKSIRDSLLNDAWEQRRTFATFIKIYLEHSGSKTNHFNEIINILQTNNLNSTTLEELTESYQTLYVNELKEITTTLNINTYVVIRRLEREVNKILNEIIIGNEDVDIAQLINSLNNRNWVALGIDYIQPDVNTCPFCQKETIDEGLRIQFEKYFDETYKDKLDEIKKLKDIYDKELNKLIENINAINKIYNPNNLTSDFLIELNLLYENNIKIFNEKIVNSNERKCITSISKYKVLLKQLTKLINTNNTLYRDTDVNKKRLLDNIWIYMANKCKNKIEEFNKRKIKYARINKYATDQIDQFNDKIDTARQNIETLRSQTVNTRESIDSINMLLTNAGFEGFEIAEKEIINNISRYYLKRPNSPNSNPVFESLSEGEKNFISFLYFYQLCLGTDDLLNSGSKKKIIIIDDPVSSLDSQSLFIVSTLIRALIKRYNDDNKTNRKLFKNNNIAQVIILTHNIYFYKEVSFERGSICIDYWHYKITKIKNQTSITGSRDKTTFDDYSLMWNSIKNIKANMPTDSSLNIVISNTMRRIIESYVNFVGYGNDSWSALVNDDQNDNYYYVKCAFISTINDESHKVSALDSVYYQKIINENPQILFDVFAIIFRIIGKEHYEMMMEEKL